MYITPETAYESLKKGKERVALRLSGGAIDTGSQFAQVLVDVVFVKDSSHRFNDSLGFYDNCYGDKHHYKDLKISASLSNRGPNCYGSKMAISPSFGSKDLDLEMLESMTKTMRTITRKLNKIDDQEGCTSDFEEMVIRLGRVLNAKSFYVKQENGIQWKRNDSMSELRTSIKKVISTALSEIGYKEKEAA